VDTRVQLEIGEQPIPLLGKRAPGNPASRLFDVGTPGSKPVKQLAAYSRDRVRGTPAPANPIELALEPTDTLTVSGQALCNVGWEQRPQFVYQGPLAAILPQKLVCHVSYGRPALPEWCFPYEDRQQETVGLPNPDLVGGTQHWCQDVIFMKSDWALLHGRHGTPPFQSMP